MRKRAILILMLIFGLVAMQTFAENRYTSEGAVVTWGNTWLRIDNLNVNGVMANIAVELSTGGIEYVVLPVMGKSARQWSPPLNTTIKEIRSINITPR